MVKRVVELSNEANACAIEVGRVAVQPLGGRLRDAEGGNTTDNEASRLIEKLGLIAHPEGGHYRELFRSPVVVSTPRGTRAASTAIWFLLGAGELSAFHQIFGSDEVWHHCGGEPLLLHLLDEHGARTVRLGTDLSAGEQPISVVPAGVLQAAEPVGKRFSLCACVVAPGFEFADFVLPSRAALCARYPLERALIERLTRT